MNMPRLLEQIKAIPHPAKITIEPTANGVRFTYRRYTRRDLVAPYAIIAVIFLLGALVALLRQPRLAFAAGVLLFWTAGVAFALVLRFAFGEHKTSTFTFDFDTGRVAAGGQGAYAMSGKSVPLATLRDFRKERVWLSRPPMFRVVATDAAGKKIVLIDNFPVFDDGDSCATFFIRAFRLCAQTSQEALRGRDQSVE